MTIESPLTEPMHPTYNIFILRHHGELLPSALPLCFPSLPLVNVLGCAERQRCDDSLWCHSGVIQRVSLYRDDVIFELWQSTARDVRSGGCGLYSIRDDDRWRNRVQPQPSAVLPLWRLLRRPVHSHLFSHVLRKVRTGQKPRRPNQLSTMRVSAFCKLWVRTKLSSTDSTYQRPTS